uniref:Uncharacterized protein n=1 Tax=Clastoptera arizonana TaxID=38151 RepID=A0A1B6BZZ2_9HEMI
MNFLESNISQRLMVSENGMPPRADSCPQFRTRKMADIAVQVDPLPQEEEAATTPDTTRTVVEINNSDTETTVTPTRPLSAEVTFIEKYKMSLAILFSYYELKFLIVVEFKILN